MPLDECQYSQIVDCLLVCWRWRWYLVLEGKTARSYSISAAQRARASRRSSGVALALVLPLVGPLGVSQEWISDGEWGLGPGAVPFYAALCRGGGPLRKGKWETKVLEVPEKAHHLTAPWRCAHHTQTCFFQQHTALLQNPRPCRLHAHNHGICNYGHGRAAPNAVPASPEAPLKRYSAEELYIQPSSECTGACQLNRMRTHFHPQ